jgi:N-sulfoglucosamine sulfohydrolase
VNRRRLIQSLGAAAVTGACSKSSKSDRPNILFILADDHSWLHTSANGTKELHTPAHDRIAREGVRFTHSFCASPSCTPSRASILSGRHVWQTGEAGLLYGAVPPDLPLYTQLLKKGGYWVGFTGKGWGPGDWRALGLDRNPCGRQFNDVKRAEKPPAGVDERDYAANFQAFLKERPSGEPFCFWFGSTEPHRLYDPGRGLRMGKKLEDVAVPPFLPDSLEVRSDILDYYTEIEWFDAQIAKLLKILEDTGELDNTMIVVTSDNGMPFPRAKANLYDWGTRMPLVIRWGAKIKGGRTVDDLVSHVDFAPTFIEIAGVKAPEGMAGKSLVPLLYSGKSGVVDPARDHVFTAMERHTVARPDYAGYPMRALRTSQHLYIRNYLPDQWPTGGEYVGSNKTTHGDIDGGPAKDFLLLPATRVKFRREVELCLNKRPAEELYDVTADPGQVNNLAANPLYGAVKIDMSRRLDDYLRQTKDPRINGQDPWRAYPYRQTTGYGASFNSVLPEDVREKARGAATHKPE